MTTVNYAALWARAHATIAKKGAPITFTRVTSSTYDAATGTMPAPAQTSVRGVAVQVRGNPLLYEALDLVEMEAPSLEFAADTYGEMAALGAACLWAGKAWTVKNIAPVAPNGVPIMAKLVVVR